MTPGDSGAIAPRIRTWVFDVDGCLVDAMTGTSLRPGVREVLASLRASGHALLLWSAGGADYARQRARQHEIDHFFDDCFGKDARDGAGYYVVTHLRPDVSCLVFVDDQPGEITPSVERIAVSSYIGADRNDRELWRVLGPPISFDDRSPAVGK
jgi:long-chain acyl-CoA synthetase